jgi:hypothetical protein
VFWTPISIGVTLEFEAIRFLPIYVIPAQAGIQTRLD